MCKTWLVFTVNKGIYKESSRKLSSAITNGTGYTAYYFDTFAGAQAKADEQARAGHTAIIYESKEFRQVQPAPIVVERTECCDPKD